MRKSLTIFSILLLAGSVRAQEKMYIHRKDGVSAGVAMERVDTIRFATDGAKLYFIIDDEATSLGIGKLDSISFGDDSDIIDIIYSEGSVKIVNPMAFDGVSVSADGTDVVINTEADSSDITYRLSGNCSDGMFKLYSDKRFNLILDGLTLANANGPAINIQSGKKGTVTLQSGTVNTLSDGSTYTDPVLNDEGEEEDQNAAFFSEGKLIFSGSGSLVINGQAEDKHGIACDDLLQIESGTIKVNSAGKDGIHAKDGIEIYNGTVNVSSSGDCIDGDEGYVLIAGGTITLIESAADAKGFSCDSIFTMNAGTLNITVNGDQSKGISAKQALSLNGGTIIINTSGDAVLESSGSGYDPSYCSAVKCSANITINGADISITASGKGGKGLSSDENIIMKDGSLDISISGDGASYTNSLGSKDSYHGSCLSANGNIYIYDGNTDLSASGSGGRGISADGQLQIGQSTSSPVLGVTTTGSKITITSSTSGPGATTGDYDESKAISCDGAVTIINGDITISSADDGIKSETSISINTATLNIIKSIEAIESPLINVNSGNISLVASDDAFNATKGNGGESNDGSNLNINGGSILVNASGGDGLDSNGNFTMTGGTVVVHGPTSSPEVGLDVNGTKNISGGLLVVAGPSSNNTETLSSSSSQYSVLATTYTSLSSSTLFHVEDSDGNTIFTYKPVRSYATMIFSSPEMQNGNSYKIYTGGSSTGTLTNGLYIGGTYSGGTLKKTVTLSSVVTTVSF